MFIKNFSIDTIIVLYDLHTRLFFNVIDKITDEDAHNRLCTEANHIAWLTGSLVHERFELANAAGLSLRHSSIDLFKCHRGIEKNTIYPSLEEFKKDWKNISPILRTSLVNLTDSQLQSIDQYGVPGDELKFVNAITFSIDRESYFIRQIGLYRRLLGYDAMKYE